MKNLTLFISIILLNLFLNSCSKSNANESDSKWLNKTQELIAFNNSKSSNQEGLKGTLTLIEGNCGPVVGEKSTCKEYPISRKIYIYEYTYSNQATAIDFTTYSKVNTKLVAIVQSDSEGYFEKTLSPGKYSIFVEEKGNLYANRRDTQGGINPISIEQGKSTSNHTQIDYALY